MRRITSGSISWALAGAFLLAITSTAYCVDEVPPAQDSRIHLKKTLYVHRAATGDKIFAETVKVKRGDFLWKILNEEYGIENRDVPEFIDAFRKVNPGVDPNRLYIDQEIRVPFKMEMSATPEPEPPSQGELAGRKDTYQVRSGDSLWKILKDSYGVSGHAMSNALAQVKRANPGLKDLNRLFVGQILVIPFERHIDERTVAKGEASEKRDTKPSLKPGLPEGVVSILGLIEKLDCEIERAGERFIPLSRGRSIRLDSKEFPLITGPGGGKVLLDPKSRLTGPVVDAIQEQWGYKVVRGVSGTSEEYLAKILPALKFHEIGEGSYSISLGKGLTLEALTRWVISPTPDALWEGGIHLIFPGNSRLDPALVKIAGKRGFAVHTMGALYQDGGEPGEDRVPLLKESRTLEGASTILDHLGVDYKIKPAVEVILESGVPYNVRPLLTFEHGALKYAIPPEKPAKAESMLLRAGYFTFSWGEDAPTLGKVADLMVLLGLEHRREELRLPISGELRLLVDGLVVESAALAEKVGNSLATHNDLPEKVFFTEANLPDETAGFLAEAGYVPWVMK